MNGVNELLHSVKVVSALTPGTITGTADSAIIVDSQFFEEIMWVIQVAAVSAADASNFLTFSIEESDDDDFSDGSEAVVSGDRLLGTPTTLNLVAQANACYKFGCVIGTKRYFRLTYTETETFSGAVGAIAILSGARHKPVA